jgi:RimJ/RimL family protein N-acetyltransferase
VDTPSPPASFSQPARLRDGTEVLIRSIRPDDRQRVIDAFHGLEPQSMRTRFFILKKELTEADLERILRNDFVHAVTLVAARGAGDDEILIGGGAYTVLERPGGPATAELSFTVEDDYHGQGLSTLFMQLLTQIAREHGIRRFEAEVLMGNAPMLKVFQHCGLPLRSRIEGGVVRLVMDLDDAPAAP